MARILQLQQPVGDAQRRLSEIADQRKQIVDEQARLRENLARVPDNSDLQRRYLATLDKQENDLEDLAKRYDQAQKAVDGAREALRNFVTQLG